MAELMIVKTQGVCGGAARFVGTRIPVWVIYSMWLLGLSDHQILFDYPTLTADHLAAARRYLEQNGDEVKRDVRENTDANHSG